MGLMDILQQYAVRPTDTHQDFEEVAQQVPPDILGSGLAQAFRSDQTPPFGNIVSQLFGNSNPSQRVGLLNELLRSAGPAVLSSIAGGALGKLLHGSNAGGAPAQVTPETAREITPEQASEIAAAAQKSDPGILDRVGSYYAQHPQVVKGLGGALLAVALGHMANRMQR